MSIAKIIFSASALSLLATLCSCSKPISEQDAQHAKHSPIIAVYKSLPPLDQKMVRAIYSTRSLYKSSRDFSELTPQAFNAILGASNGAGFDLEPSDLSGLFARPVGADSSRAEIGYATYDCPAKLQSMRKSLLSLAQVSTPSQVFCSSEAILATISLSSKS